MLIWASLVAQLVKNLSAKQETWVGSLGLEDPLEKGMVTYPSALAGKSCGQRRSHGLQSTELQTVGQN